MRVAICLALCVSLSLSSFASPAPLPDTSVRLSQVELDSVYSALEQSQAALTASSKLIKEQWTQLSALSIFSGVLVIVVLVESAILTTVFVFR